VENQDLRSEVANLNDLSNDLKAGVGRFEQREVGFGEEGESAESEVSLL
jgi:hypothetical protein